MSGLEQLQECLGLVLSKVEGIERTIGAAASESRAPKEDMTRPFTAEQLCDRWHVEAKTKALQLVYLNRLCHRWGLRPLSGTKGWTALYHRADVLHAESYAGGKTKRRMHA